MTTTRRQTLAAVAGAALAATTRGSGAAAPAPRIPTAEDYEFVAHIDISIGRWTPKPPGPLGGTVTPGTYRDANATYLLSGGRIGGAWHLSITPILVEDARYGNDIEGPVLLEVSGQTDGPEPLDLIVALVGGILPAPGQHCIYGLSEREFAALSDLPADEQAAVIADLQDPDADAERSARAKLKALGEADAPEASARGLIAA